MKKKKNIVAVDFFCGGGGLTRGLLDAGIEVKKGFDNDFKLKETYENNNPGAKFFASDVCDLKKENVLSGIDRGKNYLLLAGCAPCQPFSNLLKKDISQDKRKNLLLQFGRLISEIKPDFLFVENVPGLKNGRGQLIFEEFEKILKKEGYHFTSSVLDAKDYGVPQTRKRLVLLGSLHGEVVLPKPSHGKDSVPFKTVRDVISKYPKVRAGVKEHDIPNHTTRALSELNLERLRHIKKDGGSRLDLPEELQLNCHKGYKGHTDVYGRMKWDRYAPTLTCKCTSISNGRFGHPTQLRGLSVREAAALQTFEDDYVFYGSSFTDNTKWVGNAVPPLFAKKIVKGLTNIAII